MRERRILIALALGLRAAPATAEAPPTARFPDPPVAEEQQPAVAPAAQPIPVATAPAAPVFAPAAPRWDAPPEPAPESDWYGEQVLLVDAAAIVTLFVAPPVGVGAYFLGGPIVHSSHRNFGTAAGSLGLRIALPLVGAALMMEGEPDCVEGDSGLCGYGRAMAGLAGAGLGAIVASVIDIAFLSHEKVEPRTQAITISPRFSWRGNAPQVSFGGSF